MGQIAWRSVAALLVVVATGSTSQGAFIIPTDGTVGSVSDSGILLGTRWGPPPQGHNDDLTKVNEVISAWNSTFLDTDLALATAQLAKFEENKSVSPTVLYDSVNGYSTSDFEWYSYDGTNYALLTSPLEILSETAIGFKWVGASGGDSFFKYYAPKTDAGDGGFSVWSYRPGIINLAYVDADGDLGGMLDPRGGYAISHLSIYGSTSGGGQGDPMVPEPTSLALAGFAGIGMAVSAIRRRRQSKAAAA